MTEFPSWHRHSATGELKHFTQGPVPADWEPAGGHYEWQTGQWIDHEIPDAPDVPPEPEDVLDEPAEEPKPVKKPRKPRKKKGA